MHTFILFSIKSILVSGLFMAWYWLGLRSRRLHGYNRFFLLFTLFASMLLPALHLHWAPGPEALPAGFAPVRSVLHTLNDNGTSDLAPVGDTGPGSTGWVAVAAAIYILVATALLLVMVMRIGRLIVLKGKYPLQQAGGVTLIITGLRQAPFSFFNWLFWKDAIPQNTAEGRLVMAHELAHIRQKHTFDKLACQLLACVFWVNPFYWLLQKELAMIHEFLADQAAIGNNDTDAFARMMLQAHYSPAYVVPEHPFFSSSIKKRLIMLQKTKANHPLARRAMVLPVAAAALLIFSFAPPKDAKNVAPAAKKIVLLLDPGHGGYDEGGNGHNLREKDLSLRIAARIQQLSAQYNVETHLTRTEDKYLTLQQRVAIANKLQPDDFISIHIAGEHMANKGNFDIAICAESPKLEQSKALGNSIFQNMELHGGIQKKSYSEKNVYVLHYNNAPSILIEFGDITNEAQMQLITGDKTLDELCGAILKGVVEANKS